MTFGGEKEFIIVQEPAVRADNKVAVSIEGDPVDLGFTVAALQKIQFVGKVMAFHFSLHPKR